MGNLRVGLDIIGTGGVRPAADGKKTRKALRVRSGMVKINAIGTIVNSEHSGHQIRVMYDAEKTGGYFIFEWWDDSDGLNPSSAFDSWVETLEGVSRFIAESGWNIHWQ